MAIYFSPAEYEALLKVTTRIAEALESIEEAVLKGASAAPTNHAAPAAAAAPAADPAVLVALNTESRQLRDVLAEWAATMRCAACNRRFSDDPCRSPEHVHVAQLLARKPATVTEAEPAVP